jgi:hypothetical protein
MKLNKIFYLNILIFLLITLIIFCLGFFIIQKSKGLSAAEEEEDITPPKVYNIRVLDVSATSSVVTWETDESADSLVNYGLDKNYGVTRDPHFDKISHKIILEDLLPGKIYYFRITSSDSEGNQGISSDYSFTTEEEEKEIIREGLSEDIIEEGEGGLSMEGVEEVLQAVEKITSEEVLEVIEEKIQEKAEEIVTPPTIILDMADVEVGTDYAIIPWKTDKLSDSIVALAKESDYNPDAEDPYIWKEGEPDELVLEHRVEITGLTPATIYHFQVSSKSELGLTGKSEDRAFKTKSILPEIYNIQLAKIEEESATIRWMTNVPCSAIVEYINLNTGEAKLEGNSSYLTVHSMKLTNLIFDTYYSAMIKVESEEEEKAESEPLTFITTRDEYPPVISKVNTESTLYPGTENKIQTIASWETDELAKCQLFYHQGLVMVDEPDSLPREEDYGIKHVQVITNFLPSTVYKFWIVCSDEADNTAKSDDFTMLTPTQEESIIDIIIKNFESTFGWVKKLKL